MSNVWSDRRLPWLCQPDTERLDWEIRDSEDRHLASFADADAARWITDLANDVWGAAMEVENQKLKDMTWQPW